MTRKRQQAPGELELLREFVNTRDVETDEDQLQSAKALVAWFAERELVTRTTRASGTDVRNAAALREALREIMLAHTERSPSPPEAWATVDRAASRCNLRVHFGVEGGARLAPDQGGVDGGLGRLLAIVHDAISHGTWERLKACREDSCQFAFYDHTKNRSGAWCVMEVCGNRAKARSYRERRRPAEAGA